MDPDLPSLPHTTKSDYFNWICLGLALVLMGLAPSGESFWIDEANSAIMAMQPHLNGWWHAVNQVASDVQMSPYFFQLWVWEKLFGAAEWTLRCNNLPWILLGIGAWFVALPRPLKGTFALLCGVSPFLWYYASEIRPYAMLFGASSLMFASLYGWATAGPSKGRFLGLGLGGLMAIGASAAALPWVALTFALFAMLLWRSQPDRSYWGLGLVLAIPATGLTALYLWSFTQGNRASSPEPSSIGSLLFVPYELLGFTGLGPGRLEMRSLGIGTLKHYLPQLGLLAFGLGAAFWAAFSTAKERIGSRKVLGLVLLAFLPALAVVLLGLKSGLRTTGRHFTPALGLILPVLAFGMGQLWRRKWAGRVTLLVLVICLLGSSIQIRVSARHRKENYRGAARIARQELDAGRKVWWVADSCGASYYGVPTSELPADGSVQLVHNAIETVKAPPDVVILSRVDVYDANHVVTQMLAQYKFRLKTSLQSFTIWEKP